eukprot:GHVH01008299.1.p1 GENE.GHVH01008299.1~~GHVH01008299.1.p1  ORF type:complete len:1067 (+),score=199.81 GHVH01008299.1:52-3252(+)
MSQDSATPRKKRSRWDSGDAPPDEIPDSSVMDDCQATPLGAAGWETPLTPLGGEAFEATPLGGGNTPLGGGTPSMGLHSLDGAIGGIAPMPGTTISGANTIVAGRGLGGDWRTMYLTESQLDQVLPKEGYEVVTPPDGYLKTRSILRPDLDQLAAQAEAMVTSGPDGQPLFNILPDQETGTVTGTVPSMLETHAESALEEVLGEDLNEVHLKAEDVTYFSALLKKLDDNEMTSTQQKDRQIAVLLLKIKNGTPAVRRLAMKEITNRAMEFGPGPLFNHILPLMMMSSLEDQERHLLVKVIDRILYKLDDKVRPFAHNVLVVIEPLLIDEDYFARVEGREIISNLAKAAGLATMIAVMRPDIDHADEFVRNTTARAFAVVASALGIPSIILFLKAVCQSRKSWQARHTGIKIVQQIAILMGCAVLPHLKQLVEIIAHGLLDDQQKVRTITALAIAALAEAAYPHGIEYFECVLRPLGRGITEHRAKGLAAFLKAIGFIIPLMHSEHQAYYTREVMVILVREFSTIDEEMKKIVLHVLKLIVSCEGVTEEYIKSEVVGHFFSQFWVIRNALDRRNSRLVIDTTVEIAKKIGGGEVISKIVSVLKDSSEPFRKMALETVDLIVQEKHVDDFSSRLIDSLVDGLLYSFQESQSDDSTVLLDATGQVINALGPRVKVYLPQIASVLRYYLNTPSARVRQQAADLIQRIAGVMQQCDEEQMLVVMGLFLFEYLGEEYPEVLGSIIGALKAIVNVVGPEKMNPPIKDLLPRLTPILKNRHEKVQENVIELIGRIADRAGDQASPKEWDRICFDLLELLKAHKKSIRRSTVNTFGYIARTIGPHDVISTLLSNLRVQERQLRVCTTIAIAIVAETCLPYTVIPAIMNEYRYPDLHVQNGCLKALSFLFEYIGEMGRDYVYTVVPLLEDALADRDIVHRQTASWVCKHLALGVQGLGCEDALLHLLNFVFPNIFETTPHLIQAVFDAMDGFRVSLGPGYILNYLLQGLFHPARRVREVFWRLYNNLYIGHQDALVAYYPTIKMKHLSLTQHHDFPDAGSDPADATRGINELYYLI